jgi:hypothetical protein
MREERTCRVDRAVPEGHRQQLLARRRHAGLYAAVSACYRPRSGVPILEFMGLSR